MSKKIKVFITVSIFVILAFTFYWYSFRPYQISKTCIEVAVSTANQRGGSQTDARYLFWKCQKQHGITE
jgi:hypothetical protein